MFPLSGVKRKGRNSAQNLAAMFERFSISSLFIANGNAATVTAMKMKRVPRLPPPGDHQAGRDSVQGCEAARDPHPHGDVRGLPEEDGADHRRLHSEPAQTRPDWLGGSGRGGVLVVTGHQYDVRRWIGWVKVHCGLRCSRRRGTAGSGSVYY